MRLPKSARIGPYEIVAEFGSGGMGEVYRARDTRLGRDVALKVLPAAFAADADRVRRFEREAQVLASLNHPNIAALYGIEQADGVTALAMELVEGPSLAERLQQRPLDADEMIRVAREICAALAAAHDRGIVHRDLKPANIQAPRRRRREDPRFRTRQIRDGRHRRRRRGSDDDRNTRWNGDGHSRLRALPAKGRRSPIARRRGCGT